MENVTVGAPPAKSGNERTREVLPAPPHLLVHSIKDGLGGTFDRGDLRQVSNDHRALRDPGLDGRLTDDGALPESTLSIHQQPAGAVGKRRLNPRNLVYPVGQIHASCRVPDDERVFDDLGHKQG
jgi:hypothetical protein